MQNLNIENQAFYSIFSMDRLLVRVDLRVLLAISTSLCIPVRQVVSMLFSRSEWEAEKPVGMLHESWSILSCKTYSAFFHGHMNSTKALFCRKEHHGSFLFLSWLL